MEPHYWIAVIANTKSPWLSISVDRGLFQTGKSHVISLIYTLQAPLLLILLTIGKSCSIPYIHYIVLYLVFDVSNILRHHWCW